MPQIGPLEILMVAVVALIVFGPEKLPEMARTVGKALAEFRRVVDDAKEEFQAGMSFDQDEPDDHPIKTALTEAALTESALTESPAPPYVTGDDEPYVTGDDEQWDPGDDSPDPSFDTASSPSEVPVERPSRLTPIPMTLDGDSSGEEPDHA